MELTLPKKIAYFSHPDFAKHKAQFQHPERPDRLVSIQNYLNESDVFGRLEKYGFESADETHIAFTHSSDYVEMIREQCLSNATVLDNDTYINRDSFSVAKLAVGACLAAGALVAKNEIDKAFCCIRPPGHHAEKEKAMGFCLFNNVAVLAHYLQNHYKYKRIAIIDWDVHHGNGTQHIFYEDNSVLYFSVHQYPLYPGTGSHDEIGKMSGTGFTINAPLLAGSGDEEFAKAIKDICLPALNQFEPEFILISAGFDAHQNDPLAQCEMTSKGFNHLTKLLVKAADQFCEGKMISVLEGGYDLQSISESVYQHILGLCEITDHKEKSK